MTSVSFAFGDSCKPATKEYVLAQYRSDADLSWVIELRRFLDVQELKYKSYMPQKYKVAANQRIYKRVQSGLKDAEITIIDRKAYQQWAFVDYVDEGADFGGDFGVSELNQRAALMMLADTPIGHLSRYMERQFHLDGASLSDTANGEVRLRDVHRRVGGKLTDAVVLAARSHAMMSPTETWELLADVGPFGQASVVGKWQRIRRLSRTFDKEHEGTVSILNEFIRDVAEHTRMPTQLLRDLVRPCSCVTAEGEHCRSTTLRGQDYCFAHSPRNIHRRRPAVRRPPQAIEPDIEPSDSPSSAQPIFSALPQTAARNF